MYFKIIFNLSETYLFETYIVIELVVLDCLKDGFTVMEIKGWPHIFLEKQYSCTVIYQIDGCYIAQQK